MKKIIKMCLAICLSVFVSQTAYAGQAGDGVNRLALQVSDNDPATLNKVLNVAANFARMQSEKAICSKLKSLRSMQDFTC